MQAINCCLLDLLMMARYAQLERLNTPNLSLLQTGTQRTIRIRLRFGQVSSLIEECMMACQTCPK